MGGLTAPGILRLLRVALLVASTTALAQVVCPVGAKSWTGATSNDWRAASNWSPAGVPGNGANVCFTTPNPTPILAGGPPPRLATIYVLSGTNLVLTSAGGSMSLSGGIQSDGTFTFAGTRTLLLNGAQTWALGSGSSTINWPINFQSTVTLSGAGDLTLAGAIAGGARVTKTSTGTLFLDGTGSTHAGGLTINAGVLTVNGTLTAEGTVAINSGATLSGTGTLGSSLITVAGGGVYSPGAGGAGTLSTNALVLTNASDVSFTVGSSTTRGAVTGALTLDGVIDITAGPGFGQGTFTLFTATGAIANNGLSLGTAPAGFSYAYQISGGSVQLVVGPPATAVALVKGDAVSWSDGTEITWEVGTEIRNLGYRVYREEAGSRHLVSGLIPGSALRAGFDPVAGRNYGFVDRSAQRGGRYWIEAIDLHGKGEWLGALDVRARNGNLSPGRSAALVARPGSSAAVVGNVGPIAKPMDPPGYDRAWRDPTLRNQWQVAASRRAVKLVVRQDGMYRVAAEQLFGAGLPVGASLSSLQLWAGGHSVAFRAVSADGSSLQAGDALEFFGQAADTRYTDGRVYWVTHGLGAPVSISSAPAQDASTSATSFLETLQIRERSLHIAAIWNPETDGFFGPPLIGTEPLIRSFSTPALDVLAPDIAVLEISVQGLTDGAHTLDVLVNGTGVGTIEGNDHDVATARFTLPPGTLVPGDNTVSVVGRTDDEIALELWQRLTYPRLYMLDGPLRFTAPAGAAVGLAGAEAIGVHVLDITSVLRPAEVTTTSSSTGTSFVTSGMGSRILYAYRDQDVLAPAVVANVPSSWHSAEGADLVIIAPRSLLPSLQPLAEQRIRDGFTVAVVDIDDVYDEFSAGEKDAMAIRAFVSNAVHSWSSPPSFVLLAGRATYDPRGWLGQPELDQVPTALIQTRYLETGSDDGLVTFDGAPGPPLAVGRLPFSSVEDMDAAVAKILGRRLASPSQSLLLVHDRDETVPFSAASAEVASAFSVWKTQDFARGTDDGATHTDLVAALRTGPIAVDFQGHGAEDLWAGRILSVADVDALSGAGASSLFVAATCLNAYYLDIGRESLGGALLRTPNGGAWGVWASSAMTLPTEHALLSKTLLSGALQEGLTLGEATLKAKLAVSDPDVRSSFQLLGDPSARAVATQRSALTGTGGPKAGAAGCSTPGAPLAFLGPLVLLLLMLAARGRAATDRPAQD